MNDDLWAWLRWYSLIFCSLSKVWQTSLWNRTLFVRSFRILYYREWILDGWNALQPTNFVCFLIHSTVVGTPYSVKPLQRKVKTAKCLGSSEKWHLWLITLYAIRSADVEIARHASRWIERSFQPKCKCFHILRWSFSVEFGITGYNGPTRLWKQAATTPYVICRITLLLNCIKSVILLRKTIFSARCNIYISRLCYDVSVRLSVRLSVTEVHWCIIANLGFKFDPNLPRIAIAAHNAPHRVAVHAGALWSRCMPERGEGSSRAMLVTARPSCICMRSQSTYIKIDSVYYVFHFVKTIGRVSYIRISLCYFCFRWKTVSLVHASMQHLMHHVTVSLQQSKITLQNNCINNTSITQPTLSFYLWLKM